MRKAKNGAFITTFDPLMGEVFFGVSTGFDFCTEHESGIKTLQNIAGITRLKDLKKNKGFFGFRKNKIKLGVDRTTILNDKNIFQGIAETEEGIDYYMFGYNVRTSRIPKTFDSYFEAFWDEESFLIVSTDSVKMKALVKAAYNKDLAFTTGGKVLTDHAGIRLIIKSKAPTTLIDQCRENDLELYHLHLKDKSIGIQKKLSKHGLEFYSCAPYWKDYSKREIHWWLNPSNQNLYNFGYFEYSDLIDWINNKGPVIKELESNLKKV